MSFEEETSGVADLAKWNEQFGDIGAFPEPKASNAGAFDWELGVAYAVKIKNAAVKRSKFGDLQLELALEVLENEHDDASVLGNTKQWVDLPKQASDLKKDRDLVLKLTHKRYGNLLRILAAAQPAVYALYDEIVTTNGKKVFKDFDGKDMSPSDFTARKEEIHSLCVAWTDKLNGREGETIDELADTLLFVEKVENKKNAKYPYTNWYSFQPENVPMHKSVSASAPF